MPTLFAKKAIKSYNTASGKTKPIAKKEKPTPSHLSLVSELKHDDSDTECIVLPAEAKREAIEEEGMIEVEF